MNRPGFVPSLMAADLMNVEKQVTQLNDHVEIYHIDIIDWHFAANMCFSPEFIRQLRPKTNALLDVHLMVKDLPVSIIDACLAAGADIISMHAGDPEVQKNIFAFVKKIKEAGKKVGIVLNPADKLENITEYLPEVDLITFMGVTPGFPKQTLIPCALEKIKAAIALREEKGYKFITMIDGGCHKATMKDVYETGVENIIMGATCLFGHDSDMHVAWKKMEEDFDEWVK